MGGCKELAERGANGEKAKEATHIVSKMSFKFSANLDSAWKMSSYGTIAVNIKIYI